MAWSGPRLTRYQRAASRPTSSMSSSSATMSPRRFGLVVAEPRRRRPDRPVLLVRLDRGEHLGHVLLDEALAAPGVDVDAEPLERRLDRRAHRRHRVVALEVAEVVAVVAVFRRLLPTP